MANYYASARSNYFRVKDAEAFKAWAESRNLEVWDRTEEKDGRFGICPLNGDDGGWPNCFYDEDADEYVDFELAAELGEHLAEGEVAILSEVGAEKLRYLNAYAVAVNWKGETKYVHLDDAIMEEAKKLGPNVTASIY